MRHLSTRLAACLAAPAAIGLIVVSGCGGNDEVTASKLSLSIAEQSKQASFQAPKSAKGGLVDLTFKNNGKAPHGVQFVQYTGNHSASDALKVVASGGNKTPSWIRGQGGTPPVPGGKTSTATLNLSAGNYVLIDSAALGGSGGPPANVPMKISSGDTGDLPSTSATVDANHTGKDKYHWSISGLKAGRTRSPSTARATTPCI